MKSELKKTGKIAMLFIGLLCCAGSFTSCDNKKLTEVVEVPLPTAEQKVALGVPDDVKADPGTFEMLPLPYAYDALSPHIDARTMEIHYSKHYLTYTNNLNRVIAGTEQEALPIEEILKKLDMSNTVLRNNAGGFYNHNVFWESMGPKAGGEPKDTLATAIARDFGSYANFKTAFEDAAEKQFGSGWVWLVVDRSGKLQVTSTPNQDNPLMPQATVPGKPILALDVWEHAYYLNYQYKRKKYIDAFFNVINWKKVGEKYEEAIAKKYS
ncbi:MAG TPA: superoxide dismutase [Flavobacterium sp.]|nr:superoxide dismutase [Flavobacterium sp.]